MTMKQAISAPDSSMTDMICVSVNGERREIEPGLTLSGFLRSLDLDPRKVAVERNLEIARRGDYDVIEICSGDRLEIVHFVGGG